MPEVCEVCLTSQYLSNAIGKIITKMEILKGRYTKTPPKGKIKLPSKIVDVDSKGKFMWMTLEHNGNSYYLLNTFGLTGQWSFEKLEYNNIRFKLNEGNIYFGDMRNFGTIEFTDNIDVLNKKLNKLAPDFLKTSF